MSTLASLAGMLGQVQNIRPWDIATRSQNAAETGLLELADLKAKQQAEQLMLERIKTDPALAQQLFGTIASLPTTAAVPPGSALTQQPFGPTGPSGAAQVVPGGQDLSRLATQGAPVERPRGFAPEGQQPQSILASLGPAGQPQGGPQQNPLLEMAQRDPRAALMLQKQIQAQQLQQMTMQEKSLDLGVKVSEGVARQIQNVTDQASLEEARAILQQIHPQAAAHLPQFYSKEAIEALQSRGIAMSEQAKNRLDVARARKLDMETSLLPGMMDEFGDASGGQTAAGGTGQGQGQGQGQRLTGGARTAAAPAEYESAITEATRLYPQVKPERIKAIIAAESNFDAKAVSPAGAKGPMQLMDATAKDMGVDDPFNVQQNVRGGTRYYAQMLTKYGGDERKALAAYNWGPKNLDDVGGDVSKAPAETQRYVAKVLGGGGEGTGGARSSATDPGLAGLEAQIARRTRQAKQASILGNESLSTRLNDEANRLTAEKNRLQERATEIPRAVEKERQLTQTKQDLERQRQAGPMLPEDRRKLLTGLRTDIRAEPTHKLYQEVRNGYQNVRIGAELDSSEGDLALIYGIAKILDPQGVVREQDFQTVASAQGQLQRWFNAPQRFFEGDRLGKSSRQDLLNMAHKLATEKLTTAQKELRSVYEPLAKEGNIDFGQLLPLEDLKPLGAQPADGKTKPVSEMTLEEARAERERIRRGG